MGLKKRNTILSGVGFDNKTGIYIMTSQISYPLFSNIIDQLSKHTDRFAKKNKLLYITDANFKLFNRLSEREVEYQLLEAKLQDNYDIDMDFRLFFCLSDEELVLHTHLQKELLSPDDLFYPGGLFEKYHYDVLGIDLLNESLNYHFESMSSDILVSKEFKFRQKQIKQAILNGLK